MKPEQHSISRGSNDRHSHKAEPSDYKSFGEAAQRTNRSNSEQKAERIASTHRPESVQGFKSFRQDFNDTIENSNQSKFLHQMEGLKLNETRFEDAEGEGRGVPEAQAQDGELQKMRMDFEETDAAPS